MDFIRDLFVNIGNDWTEFLLGYLSPSLVTLINFAVGGLILIVIALLVTLGLIWAERKFIARVQKRLGPNRAGPWGLLQAIADALKLMIKEDITPFKADRVVYNLAPIMMVFAALMLIVVVPWGPTLIGADLSIGVIYIVALGSISTLGVVAGGWASNNKYALLGGFRVVAQLLSYEIPLLLTIASIVILSGTMSMQGIVREQSPLWNIFIMPAAAVVFILAASAELARTPFDLLEAESEIIAGFNIEYSGIKFAWIYLGEYIGLGVWSAITTALFLGGWQGPFVGSVPVLGPIYFLIKMIVVIVVFLWIRATFPRLRIDQLQALAWKVMVPVTLINIFIVAVAVKLPGGWPVQNLFTLALNVVLGGVTLGLLGRAARHLAQKGGGRMPVPSA